MTDQTTTPLADALAGVDATMGTEGNPYGDPARELAALRDLAEAVRLYLLERGPRTCINCGKAALTAEQAGTGQGAVHKLNGTVSCMDGWRKLSTVCELAPLAAAGAEQDTPESRPFAKGDRVSYTVMYSDGQGFGRDHIVHRAHYGRITRIRPEMGSRGEDRAVIAVEKPKPGSTKYVERYVSDIAHVAEGIGQQPGLPEKAEPEKVYDGYTHEQLSEAFALVKNRENWKLPIAATVPADADRACISAAVVFFTGSTAEFIPGRRGLHVGAAGYYAAIGS